MRLILSFLAVKNYGSYVTGLRKQLDQLTTVENLFYNQIDQLAFPKICMPIGLFPIEKHLTGDERVSYCYMVQGRQHCRQAPHILTRKSGDSLFRTSSVNG